MYCTKLSIQSRMTSTNLNVSVVCSYVYLQQQHVSGDGTAIQQFFGKYLPFWSLPVGLDICLYIFHHWNSISGSIFNLKSTGDFLAYTFPAAPQNIQQLLFGHYGPRQGVPPCWIFHFWYVKTTPPCNSSYTSPDLVAFERLPLLCVYMFQWHLL